MTIDQLIERLEELRDELGGDTEVRLMTQEEYPHEYGIVGCCSSDDINNMAGDDDDDDDPDAVPPGLVYIVEGDYIGYGTDRAWDVASY